MELSKETLRKVKAGLLLLCECGHTHMGKYDKCAKCNWVDLYLGANLPLNLRKQSVIKGEDISVVSESAGYENECGGRLARQTLCGVSK